MADSYLSKKGKRRKQTAATPDSTSGRNGSPTTGAVPPHESARDTEQADSGVTTTAAATASTTKNEEPAGDGVSGERLGDGGKISGTNKKKKMKKNVKKLSMCEQKDAEGENAVMVSGQNGSSHTAAAVYRSTCVTSSSADKTSEEDVKGAPRRKSKKAKRSTYEDAAKSTGTVVESVAVAVAEGKSRPPLSCATKVHKYAIQHNLGKADGSRKAEGPATTSARKGNKRMRDDEKTKRQDENQSSSHGDINNDEHTEENQTETVEGVLHEGVMYLVDNRKRVFSVQRDARGELVQVGIFDTARGGVVVEVIADSAEMAASAKKADDGNTDADKTNGNKQKKKKKEKKGSSQEATAGGRERGLERAAGKAVGVVEYPFEVEAVACVVTAATRRQEEITRNTLFVTPWAMRECDHCETSERAYADIVPLLAALAREIGKNPEELTIYDPYYCQGSTVARLTSLGFPNVYNRKEDFYQVVQAGKVPEHDVVVTNPPFSGDHVSKILRFCSRPNAKPWFLLLPNYVYLKDYFEPSLAAGGAEGGRSLKPFYLTPSKRYSYNSPQGSRLNVKSSERKTSPFNTFWYIRLGDSALSSKILQLYDMVSMKSRAEERCCVARTPAQIPYKMMDSNDPRRKKARDRQRSIHRIRKKKSEWLHSDPYNS